MEKIFIKPKKRVNPDRYFKSINGTLEEKIFCAFMAVCANPNVCVNAEEFLSIYIQLTQMAFAGITIDCSQQKVIEGTKLAEDIHLLKGNHVNLLQEDVILNIAKFLSRNNATFCDELKAEIAIYESKLLLSEVLPVISLEI